MFEIPRVISLRQRSLIALLGFIGIVVASPWISRALLATAPDNNTLIF